MHTLRFGFSCTDVGPGWLDRCFGGASDCQGEEPGSSPISGTCFPRSGGFGCSFSFVRPLASAFTNLWRLEPRTT